jgi:hypothetical protein
VIITDAFPQFNKKYGEMLPDGTYQVPARWQAGLSNVSWPPRKYFLAWQTILEMS